VDSSNGEFHIGSPRPLPLPESDCEIAAHASGRIVALAAHSVAYVFTPDRTFQVGPLDDCRSVSLSPNGKWLATGSHSGRGIQVWRISDAGKVAEFPVELATGVLFSPDGKWLMTCASQCRLWDVGTWKEARQIGGLGLCFSPDGRQLVVQDADKVLRLVEVQTGRTLARLESPDLCALKRATFSPDGTRLVISTDEGPAVHVWDLRAIRRNLAEMGLDWDAPAYPETSPAVETTSGPPLHVVIDLGPLKANVQSILEQQQATPEVQSLAQQAQQLQAGGKFSEAIAALRQAVGLAPALAEAHNSLAWLLATAPEPFRNPAEAIEHARRAVELAPGNQLSLNTLGVALYRAGKFAEAVETLEKCERAGQGEFAAFDLFFLAMAHYKLGHGRQAHTCFEQATRWFESSRKTLTPNDIKELTSFRAEAERTLAVEAGALPDQVLAEPH
jgi:Tfp pilus assembly protein PilF